MSQKQPVKHRTVRLGSQKAKAKAEKHATLVKRLEDLQPLAVKALALMGRELPKETA